MAARRAPHGYLPQSASKPLKQFGKGRVCWYPACETRLSTYNSGGGCALHPAEPDFKRRARFEQEWGQVSRQVEPRKFLPGEQA